MGKIPEAVIEALEDDLNTPKAIAALEATESPGDLLAGAQFMGLLMETYENWFQATVVGVGPAVEKDRAGKITAHEGVSVGTAEEKDTAHFVRPVTTIADDQIELLIKERELARKNDDYERSDQIRDKLKSEGIVLEDNPDGTTWRRGD